MKASEFFKKITSGYLWGNLFAMAVLVVLISLGVKYGLDVYTHHGEAIQVPNVKYKGFKDAERILEGLGLVVHVSDTGYVKTLPPDCVLEQNPDATTSATHLKFNILQPESSLVEEFTASKNRKNSSKYTAAMFDHRGYTVIVVFQIFRKFIKDLICQIFDSSCLNVVFIRQHLIDIFRQIPICLILIYDDWTCCV